MRRFSLVELVAVMAIVAAMLAVALPAFNALMSGSSVQQGSRAVGSQLHLARQQALARRRHVAFILPGPRESQLGIGSSYWYRCYRMAYVEKQTGGGYEFRAWVENTRWRFLPNNCSVMEADADIGINQTGTEGVFTKQPADNGMTRVDGVDFRELNGYDAADGVRSLVFSPAGRLKGTARFVTLGEAIKSGSFWTIRNPVPAGTMATNESCANQVTLEVNRFTGGVTYYTPEDY